eukprot:3899035-Pyramimonas_sp.AAC.1
MDHGEGEGRGHRERLGGRTVLLRAKTAQQPEDFSIEESKHAHPEDESARILQAPCQRQGQVEDGNGSLPQASETVGHRGGRQGSRGSQSAEQRRRPDGPLTRRASTEPIRP